MGWIAELLIPRPKKAATLLCGINNRVTEGLNQEAETGTLQHNGNIFEYTAGKDALTVKHKGGNTEAFSFRNKKNTSARVSADDRRKRFPYSADLHLLQVIDHDLQDKVEKRTRRNRA